MLLERYQACSLEGSDVFKPSAYALSDAQRALKSVSDHQCHLGAASARLYRV